MTFLTYIPDHNQSTAPETQFHVMEMQPLKDTNGVSNLNAWTDQEVANNARLFQGGNKKSVTR